MWIDIAEDHARGLSTFTVMAGLGGFCGYALGGINWDVTALGKITFSLSCSCGSAQKSGIEDDAILFNFFAHMDRERCKLLLFFKVFYSVDT